MAPSVGTLRVGRYFMALLLIFIALYAIVGFSTRHTPKLGIDLVGGKRAIFTARTDNGAPPTSNSMDQARQIIENRVNAQGVTGATVQVQNNDQLVVIIPGGTKGDVAELGQPAKLNFRGLIAPAVEVTCSNSAGATPTPSSTSASSAPSGSSNANASSGPSSTASSAASSKHAGNSISQRQLTHRAAPSAASSAASTPATDRTTASGGASSTSTSDSSSPTTSATTSTAPTSATSSPAATVSKCTSDPFAALVKAGIKVPTSETAYDSLTAAQQSQVSAALSNFKCKSGQDEPDIDNSYYLACDSTGTVVYLLGTVIVPGTQIASASAQAPSTSGQSVSGQWTVQVNLKSAGSSAWADWTGKYNSMSTTASSSTCGKTAGTIPCSDFVGFTLNGEVISSPPQTNEQINGLPTQISGSTFTQSSTDTLAQELNYGSLPLSFKLQSNESVSATLGAVQLRGAFIAGGIGLALVVLYSLAYYRGLGLITIASLLVSAGLTYAMLVILGKQIGFTLDLAGIAGFIVALGITADSFVVFFERIKDEVHEGRSMRVAVPRAWVRARRTILSADTVSFLAAAILYYFASADVKGFAFTLGLSTILDLVVVFLFTHPIVSLLSRSRTFGSPRFTGLNSVRTGTMISDDESDLDSPRRRPARTAAASSARERAAGRRGIATMEPAAGAPAADESAVDESSVESPTDEDEALEHGSVTPVAETSPTESSGPTGASGSSGGSAAERAAARRARRRAAGSGEGSDSEGKS